MLKLLECDIQGGLIDIKTRAAVQYTINLLLLDAIPLFGTLRTAGTRELMCICDFTYSCHDSFTCDTINLLLLDAVPLFKALCKAGMRELMCVCDFTYS